MHVGVHHKLVYILLYDAIAHRKPYFFGSDTLPTTTTTQNVKIEYINMSTLDFHR